MSSSTKGSEDSVVWLDGALLQASRATVSPFDHGLLTGDGVFETLVAHRGEPFAQSRHWNRLKHSAEVMGLEVPAQDTVLEAMRAVLKANGLEHARIRVTLTSGVGPLGSLRGHGGQTLLIAASPIPAFPALAKVITVPYPRNDRGVLAGVKTVSYGENVVALWQARQANADEAIFGNLSGSLCEGTGTNIFIAREGKLITPPLSAGCLAGVTRSIVLNLCHELGVDVQEVDTPLSGLETVDEAFLSSTLRDVQPIAVVNGRPLGEAPGPFGKQLVANFQELVMRKMDP